MIDGQPEVNLMQERILYLLTIIFFVIKCFQYLWNLGQREKKENFKDVLFKLISLQVKTLNNFKHVHKKRIKCTILE